MTHVSGAELERTIIALDRELVRRYGFYKFVELAWQHVPYNATTPFVPAWHIEEMCVHAEACVPGSRLCPNPKAPPLIQELVANVPPGYTKSMVFSVLFQAWVWTFRPEYRAIYASFDDGMSKLNAGHMRDLVRSKWYVQRWGNVLDPLRSRTVGFYMTRAGGFRFSTSIGGKGTGRHCHAFLVDDPVKPPPEESGLAGDVSAQIKYANQWLKNVMASRALDAVTYVKIIVMQRLAEADPSGEMLKSKTAVNLKLPAKYDPKSVCTTCVGGDRRAANFASPYARVSSVHDAIMLNPLRFPVGAEDKRAAAMGGWEGVVASAQLQQEPAPAGGLIFKKDTFKKFRATQIHHSACFLVLSVDCNFKKSPINSDVGLTVEGILPDGRILTYWAGSETLGWVETRERVLQLVREWRPNVILIEDKANGSALLDELRTTFQLGNVLGPNPDTTKESRAHAANVSYQAGMVWHNIEMGCGGNLGGVDDFEGSLAKFPRGLKKDVIDAHSQAVLYLASTNEALKMAALDKMGDLTTQFQQHFNLG